MNDIPALAAQETKGNLRRTQRQLLLFGLFGGAQLLVDWLCFLALTWVQVDVVVANVAGRVIGAALGFWLNGRHTFATTDHVPLGRKHAVRFAAGWMITALLSTVAVWLVDDIAGLKWAQAGKLIIDGLLALVGFVLSKYWIFR